MGRVDDWGNHDQTWAALEAADGATTGRPVTSSAAAERVNAPGVAVDIDEQGQLTADLPCRACGYNLRGLPRDGRCPECGAAVELSLRGDLLRYADPTWVLRLGRGANLWLWGFPVVILGILSGVAFASNATERVGTAVGVAASVFGFALMYYGLWLLTQPDPSGVGETTYGFARRVTRITLAISVLGSIFDVVARMGSLLPVAVIVALGLLFTANLVLSIFARHHYFHYFAKLAERIPDEHLAKRANRIKWDLATSTGVSLLVFYVLLPLGGPGAGGRGGFIVFVVALCIGVVFAEVALLYWAAASRLLYRLHALFDTEAAAARESWAALDPAGRP